MAGKGDKAKPKISDEERSELMKKMDKDLEKHFKELEEKALKRLEDGPKRMDGGWTEDNWEEEMQQHPYFNQGWKEGEDLSPLMQGMQDLKYSPEENTKDELALNYKEDGNFNFKCKKYRFAVASYTEGLRAKSDNIEVNTQLLTNRAAAQFHIGNYRSSLRDCSAALRLTPAHMKAIVRGADCTLALKDYIGCKEWCDKGLKLDSGHKELNQKRKEAVEAEKTKLRDERRRAAAENRKKKEEENILQTLKERGIRICRRKGENPLSLEDLEPSHPAAQQRKVHVDESGELVWPVLFLYPEHGETDFIEEFRENEQFVSHLEVMFGEQSPPWDPQGRTSHGVTAVFGDNTLFLLGRTPIDLNLVGFMINFDELEPEWRGFPIPLENLKTFVYSVLYSPGNVWIVTSERKRGKSETGNKITINTVCLPEVVPAPTAANCSTKCEQLPGFCSWSKGIVAVGGDMAAKSCYQFGGHQSGLGCDKLANLNKGRVTPAVVSEGDMLYAVGGFGFFWHENEDSVEVYDQSTNIWSVDEDAPKFDAGGYKAFVVNKPIRMFLDCAKDDLKDITHALT